MGGDVKMNYCKIFSNEKKITFRFHNSFSLSQKMTQVVKLFWVRNSGFWVGSWHCPIVRDELQLQISKAGCASHLNKPDRAKMRPDCVSACIDHVTYTERQMDEQTGETTE